MTIDPGQAGPRLPFPGDKGCADKEPLTVRVALITGGDVGIGRTVTVAHARKGAARAISATEAEQSDAGETTRWVE